MAKMRHTSKVTQLMVELGSAHVHQATLFGQMLLVSDSSQ